MGNLETPLNQDISASRAARKIFKKTKLSSSKNLKDETILVPVVLIVQKWQIKL